MTERVTSREGGPGTRCPYCHDDLPADVAATACDLCGARHHADCWLGRCASCMTTTAPGQPARASPLAHLVCAVVAVTPTVALVGSLSSTNIDPEAEFMGLALLLALPIVGLLATAPWFLREAWRGWTG